MALHRFATSHVLGRIQKGGSSSPVIVETAGGRFVAKLRGAGEGVLPLIAEIIVAELAQTLGLPVPEHVLIELTPDFVSDDRNDELADLLQRSVGLSVGFRSLDGARVPRPEELAALDDDFVARVLWLDGLTQNLDRTPANPNLLFWKQRPYLIDHGTALTFHHDWRSLTEETPREPWSHRGHLFESRLAVLARFDDSLSKLLPAAALAKAVGAVPEEFLVETSSDEPARTRAAYQAYLWKRLKPPRPFLA